MKYTGQEYMCVVSVVLMCCVGAAGQWRTVLQQVLAGRRGDVRTYLCQVGIE